MNSYVSIIIVLVYYISALICTFAVITVSGTKCTSLPTRWLLLSIATLVIKLTTLNIMKETNPLHIVLFVFFWLLTTYCMYRKVLYISHKRGVFLSLYFMVIQFIGEGLCLLCFYILYGLDAYVDFVVSNLFRLVAVTFTNISTQLDQLLEQRQKEYQYHLSALKHLNSQHFARHEYINQLQVLSSLITIANKREDALKFINTLVYNERIL